MDQNVSVSDAYHATDANTVRQFESLGSNCEFGLVQRHFGVEKAGLLKWGASWDGIRGIIRGLECRFEGAGDQISLDVHGTEYISKDETFNFIFHTDRHVGQVDTEVLLRNERARIAYLARNLIETMEDGSFIFVYKADQEPEIQEIKALVAAMRSLGPTELLWVTVTSETHRYGLVERADVGLIRGFMDRFSPAECIHEYCSFDLWATICKEALRIRDVT